MAETMEKHELKVDNFATISGIRGKQFGRDIYSTVIQFKDLISFLEVFPDVQRDVTKRRVNQIKKYVLSGLEDHSAMRFFSAITVTARGSIFYDEDKQRVAIDTKNSKLSVNDGQHRFYGISEAINTLSSWYNRASDENEQEAILKQLNDLKQMVIPIVIFNGIGESEEKQLFHDLNNLAQRPSRSATIRLAQTDLYSRMSRELAEGNVYLNNYGVETDKMSIHKNNPNLILLTTIHYVVQELIGVGEETLLEDNYAEYKQTLNGILDKIFENLPDDINQKGKYLIEKNYAMKGIAKYIATVKNIGLDDGVIYKTIKETDWTNSLEYWSKYGGTEGSNGVLFAGDGGVKAILECLLDKARNERPEVFQNLN